MVVVMVMVRVVMVMMVTSLGINNTVSSLSFPLLDLRSVGGGGVGLIRSDVDVLINTGEAVRSILKTDTLPYCSAILILDANSSPTAVYETVVGRVAPFGVGVVEVGGGGGARHNNNNDNNNNNNVTTTQMKQAIALAKKVLVSVDPAFIALWAKVADEERLLVWRSKVLVVSRLPRPSLHPLLSTHWALANMNVMLVNAETHDDHHLPHMGPPRCGVFSHLPYTRSGEAETVRVASWTPTQHLTILSTQLTLYPEKGANFHGGPVTLGANTLTPYWQQWEVINNEGVKEMKYAGRGWLMIEPVAHKLNFTPVQVITKDWVEVMALIQERVIYISPVAYTVMPHQLAFNDYTTFIEPDTLTFGMALPSLAPRWQALYYPLAPVVWLLVLLSILVYPAVLLLLSYNGSSDGKRLRVMVVMEATATLLGQPLPRHLPQHTSLRLLVGAWLLFGVIFATAYRGNLTAFLTIPIFPPRAETLHQLIMTDTM
ncbi:hypothetical protein Pmani_016697 [Petrolisthes manimaculis]|uniref:Ionotropic glutamate receptor C-terminal domain-containing protein n=1 Tax=Petrolisthes manimaculis TaxID=1843537 RepID=A0AAE1U6G1_9EUCA|nr:hypothetical protein Pmani_016697 [Petrolisthes manimaculis]